MNFHLTLTPQQFAVVWAGLGELPGKTGFATMEVVKAQIAQQEAEAQAPKVSQSTLPEVPDA